jgi:mRNA interferase YafQ
MSKRGFDMLLLDDVIRLLATGQVLPQKNRDHTLSGNYAGHRECHIAPDWLLIYRVDSKMLILELMQTGTHSDLF